MTEHHKLRDALLAIEPAKPELREQLQQEIQNMFVRKLSTTTQAVLWTVRGCMRRWMASHPATPADRPITATTKTPARSSARP